eukprot:gnl/Ergobibamus_cyprinoides/2785.p1 GENE.gnl/Ergobibamus_cyprinoides/2785~~gnl/Ergobibamus_cyprinoides/2785.p1  ORF type:complete len:114 (-),score=21.26 gnl/Ergobibamus_cyprinoides/2785:29-370(-)
MRAVMGATAASSFSRWASHSSLEGSWGVGEPVEGLACGGLERSLVLEGHGGVGLLSVLGHATDLVGEVLKCVARLDALTNGLVLLGEGLSLGDETLDLLFRETARVGLDHNVR